jgi:Domain of unknown function (DUF4112)
MHQPNQQRLDLLRRWAVLLDSAFRVPGTNFRFGVDAILGLVPGLGDLSAPVYAAFMLVTGLRMRVPAIVMMRMVLNAGLDMLMGFVPILGDVADVFFKANLRNMALLERHARPGVPASRGDYFFVGICLFLVFLIALAPFVVLIWLLTRFSVI